MAHTTSDRFRLQALYLCDKAPDELYLVDQRDFYMQVISRFSFAIGLSVSSAVAALADIPTGVTALEKGDVETAAKEFQNSFDTGDADGAFYLGRMFELGLGTNPDISQASELYKVAAAKDSALAQNRLGLMYFDGQTVIRDYAKGAELICKAADAGEANAQFNCGAAYGDGKGVDKDPAKAMEYWQKASDQGHIAATNFLGLAYKNGDGVAVDAAKSFQLFMVTAEQGNPMGLFEAAVALDTGLGTEADKLKAYTYANIAAARAHPEAPDLRDRIEAQLTSDEVNQAQKAAREWIADAMAKAEEASDN